MKKIGIYLLMGLCIILMIITWILWIPYMLSVFPFTGKFMHEHELPMYPHYWYGELQEKL